jgi:hypothetical protein
MRLDMVARLSPGANEFQITCQYPLEMGIAFVRMLYRFDLRRGRAFSDSLLERFRARLKVVAATESCRKESN